MAGREHSQPGTRHMLSRVQLHAKGYAKHCMSVEKHSEEHNYEVSVALGQSADDTNVCTLEVRHWGWEFHTDEYEWDDRNTFAGVWAGDGGGTELDEMVPDAFVLYDLRKATDSHDERLLHKIRLTYSAAMEGQGAATVTLDAGWGELVRNGVGCLPLGASAALQLTVKDSSTLP